MSDDSAVARSGWEDASAGRSQDRGSGSSGRTVIVQASSAVKAGSMAERLNPGYIVEEKGVARRTLPLRKSPGPLA